MRRMGKKGKRGRRQCEKGGLRKEVGEEGKLRNVAISESHRAC